MNDSRDATQQRIPLNEDRDPLRWANEFNDWLYVNGAQHIDQGVLIGWFANAMMCGEDTYRWKLEKEGRIIPSAVECTPRVTDEMVSRFLGWRLPQDFAPDAGISFKPVNHPDALTHLWPVGTNLFTAGQAKAMLEHVLAVTPSTGEGTSEPIAWMWQHPETGMKGFIEHCSEEDRRHWERMNRPRQIVRPVYDHVAPSSIGGRTFHVCEDHKNADWNQPELDDDACVLCRLFYLEAQESLLEEWQQRAKRAEEAAAEIQRPLDAQMARLNETVVRLNAENERLIAPITEEEAAQLLDDGFSVKVLNCAPPDGNNGGKNYWRCPHCGMADYDGHEQSCIIRALVERLLGRVVPFGTIVPSARDVGCSEEQEISRRIWHRQCGLEGKPCPSEYDCEAFDIGFSAGVANGVEQAAKIASGYLHVHPIAKQIKEVLERHAADVRPSSTGAK